jgi:hypothetical protein
MHWNKLGAGDAISVTCGKNFDTGLKPIMKFVRRRAFPAMFLW